jgi:hypothetical protein
LNAMHLCGAGQMLLSRMIHLKHRSI